VKGRSFGVMHPGLLTLLALSAAGCPDEPEPAGTSAAPTCKPGECPVDQEPPSPPLETPTPAPATTS
jgi:hypothetical protein